MAWTGKLLGGLVGGMVGGPVGLGVGAALGHWLADGDAASADRSLALLRLEWRHHAFAASGPGVRVVPIWRAVGKEGQDVAVHVGCGDVDARGVVTLDTADETVSLPSFFLPYRAIDPTEVAPRARVHAALRGGGARDEAVFDVPLPNRVRRMGSSGPARLVMALVACARADGRRLARSHGRFVEDTFRAAHALDDRGHAWLRAWAAELDDADVARLAAARVARRLEPHLAETDRDTLLTWLMRGVRHAWPGAAQEAWAAELALALGRDAADIARLWAGVQGEGDEHAEAAALLGVPPGCSLDVARGAWLRLVRQHHPDLARDPEDAARRTRRTAALNAAWQVLQAERGGSAGR